MKTLLLMLIIFSHVYAKEKIIGVLYFSRTYGHVHKNSNSLSRSLTTISCGYPIKVVSRTDMKPLVGWVVAKVGDDTGYIKSEFLSQKRQSCLQNKYKAFMNNLSLDITDMYYWGRLNDQYIEGTSKTQ